MSLARNWRGDFFLSGVVADDSPRVRLENRIAAVCTSFLVPVGGLVFWEKPALSWSRIEGKWMVFDVANGLAFRNKRGDLASVEELAAVPGLVKRTVSGPSTTAGSPTTDISRGLCLRRSLTSCGPRPSCPGPGLYEAKRLVGSVVTQ